MDTETYAEARQSGDFEKYEAIMNDSRSGTAAQREMAARKVAAHKSPRTLSRSISRMRPIRSG